MSTALAPPARPGPIKESLGSTPGKYAPGRRSISRRWVFVAGGLLLAAENALLASGGALPVATSVGGLACAVGIPTFVLYMADVGRAPAKSERLANSLMLTLVLLMGAGLSINAVLPLLGVRGPLGPVPVVVTVDALCIGLAAWGYRRQPENYRVALPALTRRDRTLLGLSFSALLLAVTGAIRLNNGAGGGVTLVMLVVVVITFALALVWRDQLRPGMLPVVIYCLALALLLMTSLRGWYTTGHDIQQEYAVFELTKTHASWQMSRFRDPYNACLSITILPTVLWQWTRMSDPYIYKVVFQILFALCPVLVYRLATRVSSRTVALLGAIYFVSFVTFFQDMPMLNRQEIAFLFLAAALLAAFRPHAALGSRRWFLVFALGMVVSHYSTTYLMIGVLVIAWAGRVLALAGARLQRRMADAARSSRLVSPRGSVLGIGTIVVVILATVIWTAPVTHTQSGVSQTVSALVASVWGDRAGARSSDTSNSIFSLGRPTAAQRLASYKRTIMNETAARRAAGVDYSEPLLARYSTPVSPDAKLPLTRLGRALSAVGLDVGAINSDVRQASAWLLQLLIGLGLLAVTFGRWKRFRKHPGFYGLAVAYLIVVLLQVVLPVLSVDYGLLRAFQQSLIVLDVFLVIGTLVVFRRLREGKRVLAAGGVALLFFASSTGLFTQLLGGYEPQLHLNNSGLYYDNYYVHPEEIAGIAWLQRQTAPGTQGAVQSDVQMDRFTSARLQTFSGVNTVTDIFPALVRRNSYVFLGYTNVRNSESTIPIDGDLVTYHYPMNFLDDDKDLVYDNGGARVYR